MKRFVDLPVSTVSARNAWHNDPGFVTQKRQKHQGNTSRKIGWGCAARFLKPFPYFGPKSVILNQSINQSIYLVRQYVRWGCPDYPSQGLVYKTHDNKNTKLIKTQYIWIRNNLKRSVINVWKQITIIYPLMLKATPSRIPLNKLKTKNRKNKFKTTDVVKS